MKQLVFSFPIIAPTTNHAIKYRPVKVRGSNKYTVMSYPTTTLKSFKEAAEQYASLQLAEQELEDKDILNKYIHAEIHFVGENVLMKDKSRVSKTWGDADNLVKYTNDAVFKVLKDAGYNSDDSQILTPCPTKHESSDGTVGSLIILTMYDTLDDYYLMTGIPRYKTYTELYEQYNNLKGN